MKSPDRQKYRFATLPAAAVLTLLSGCTGTQSHAKKTDLHRVRPGIELSSQQMESLNSQASLGRLGLKAYQGILRTDRKPLPKIHTIFSPSSSNYSEGPNHQSVRVPLPVGTSLERVISFIEKDTLTPSQDTTGSTIRYTSESIDIYGNKNEQLVLTNPNPNYFAAGTASSREITSFYHDAATKIKSYKVIHSNDIDGDCAMNINFVPAGADVSYTGYCPALPQPATGAELVTIIPQ